jgi:sporulation protein YlmC with PRC-barrel domain
MLLSELLNRKVVTESGRRLGRVHDVHAELTENRLRITGLVPGGPGLLERYGIGTTGGTAGPGSPKAHGHPLVPWKRVIRVGREIVVSD